MTIHVGITGTRRGCNPGQWYDLCKFFAGRPATEIHFHHGDCVGVDAESVAVVRRYSHWPTKLPLKVIAHPPVDPKLRAYCVSDIVLPEKPYMERNQDIVDAVNALIVVPSGPEADNPRSGTWATYRMAVRAGVETVVIEP